MRSLLQVHLPIYIQTPAAAPASFMAPQALALTAVIAAGEQD